MNARSLRPLVAADYGEAFTLQRAAFVDEARIYGTPFVPALDETFDEFSTRLDDSVSWAALLGARIVGAVSLRSYRPGGPDVERLMVAPDCRRQGIASILLTVAEDHARDAGYDSMQLIVGADATTNRSMYKALGWIESDGTPLEDFPKVVVHTMTKHLEM